MSSTEEQSCIFNFHVQKMSSLEKTFAIGHTFENLQKMEIGDEQHGKEEWHFQLPWKMSIERVENINGAKQYSFNLQSLIADNNTHPPVSLKINFTLRILSRPIFTCPTEENVFFMFPRPMQHGVVFPTNPDEVPAVFEVTVVEQKGLYKKLRNFDESMKKYSDIALVAEGEKFYVSKLFLTAQSKHFDDLLSRRNTGVFDIKLNDVYAMDIQKYLEVLYGDPAINDNTVEALLNMGKTYSTPTVTERSEKFLLTESKKDLVTKVELAVNYQLEELKIDCFSKLRKIQGDRLGLAHKTYVNWIAVILVFVFAVFLGICFGIV